jgi:hypothetical protein
VASDGVRLPTASELGRLAHGSPIVEYAGLWFAVDEGGSPPPCMAPYVGARLSLDELFDTENMAYANDEERRGAHFVRAFPVVTALGRTFSAATEGDIPGAVVAFLEGVCPGTTWPRPERYREALRKYGFLHLALDAPRDGATGHPMELELFAWGICLEGREPGAWWMLERVAPGGYMDRPVRGPLAFRVETATYANVAFPGVGIPFYA